MNFPPSSSSNSIHHYPPPAADDREHMFDKVVTPSDVGKLNRLVIPKQHAERFFPLHPAAGDKGLLLAFEDSAGISWRFRYSYWSSSQSYVITKGWSRFVKDKTLLAGDLISFHRAHGRFYIDWRHRLPEIYNHQFHHLLDHPFPFFHRPELVVGFSPPPVFWLSRGDTLPVENMAVPVVHGKVAAKRLRLFGVNMDCPNVDDDHEQLRASLSSPLTPSHHHLVDHKLSSSSNGVALSSTTPLAPLRLAASGFLDEGKPKLSPSLIQL